MKLTTYQLFLMFLLGATPFCFAENIYRVWTSRVGDEITAEYVRMEGKYVVLQPTNGQAVKIAFSALVANDQAFLKKNYLPRTWEQVVLEDVPQEITAARAKYAAQEFEAARTIVADIDGWVNSNRAQLSELTRSNSRLARAALSLLNQSYKRYIFGIGAKDDSSVEARQEKALRDQQ